MEEKYQEAFAKIVAKAWSDAEFKRKLIAEPNAVLTENGIAVPAGITIKIVEDTATVKNVTLPSPPDELDLDELEKAAGGSINVSNISIGKTQLLK